ncbi:LacI family DNA-binding transcriptional regulator [Streptomyces iranensis]|uniref:LacI family transcriptional regulator n=1 Tax=Streptomyces iranensis TaxID=576784 RepID=A0A060ZBT5_9ACTN|nr:LacI family DNA-binding transcriptional regulator [Streptomyces iranensis]MBP2063348.1 LacI family transcriptional regulator [Streptomyces iranensis]CDR01712.1 LacI family transcriptional regulator [Streptomyces iranensis]
MTRRNDRPSIESVAAAAGVSPTTVSHALSGKRAVSAATRKRVMEAVEQQNYRPNMVARGLRSRRTQSVALLLVDIANPYYPALARAIHDVLAGEGYVSFIGNTDGDAATERRLLEEMVARGVDGVVMQPMALSAAQVREVVGPAMPLVITTDEYGDIPADSVLTDDTRGLGEAVDHLVRQGIRELGFVDGAPGTSTDAFRLQAFRAAVTAAGIEVPDRWIEHSPFDREGGAAATARLLAGPDRPRAVLCANDLIAIGAVQAAHAAGLRVPEDVAIVGFDDIETAALVSPRLTTVVNPAAAVGDACARTILWRVENGPDVPRKRTVLPTRLVVRQSA